MTTFTTSTTAATSTAEFDPFLDTEDDYDPMDLQEEIYSVADELPVLPMPGTEDALVEEAPAAPAPEKKARKPRSKKAKEAAKIELPPSEPEQPAQTIRPRTGLRAPRLSPEYIQQCNAFQAQIAKFEKDKNKGEPVSQSQLLKLWDEFNQKRHIKEYKGSSYTMKWQFFADAIARQRGWAEGTPIRVGEGYYTYRGMSIKTRKLIPIEPNVITWLNQ